MAITFLNGFTIGGSTLGTINNPAISAVQLYNAGIQTNGWYYIKTGMMTSSMQVYCNQTDNGGGWMLISYNPSGSTQLGYPYPNQYSGSSNPNALDINTSNPITTVKTVGSALTGSWSAIKGYTFMTASSYPVAAPPDWLYDTSNWWTTNGPTNAYPDAPYGRSGNAQGTGGWTNRNSNQVYGLLGSVTTTGNALTSNFNTLAVYIK